MQNITCRIKQPDDFHAHLRTGPMLAKVIEYSNVFGKVLAMGNLTPPIATTQDARRYRMEIYRNNPKFFPIISIMLVNKTTTKMVLDAYMEGAKVLKLIPGGTSTGSDDGVTFPNLKKFYPVLKIAENLGMIFSVHWELMFDKKTGNLIPERDREEAAIPNFADIVKQFPRLRIVAEHASTAAMVKFVEDGPANVAATITAHHIGPYDIDDVIDRDKIFDAYLYCKPILKSRYDIRAVLGAMLSGNPKFFFGSDSAPHPLEKKLAHPPAAGIFSPAFVSLPHIWDNFHEYGKSASDFENFVSRFGSRFYGLRENDREIMLIREDWTVPDKYNGIAPFMAGRKMHWKIK